MGGAPANYIEDVFSTYLYTGNGSTNTQTISNGIDESGKGALTWFKKRSTTSSHLLFDTNRGTDSPLATNSTSGQGSGWSSYFNFLSNGVSVSDDLNVSGTTYASWTFRKQPKFFDVVTYTGDGTSNRAVSHNLGSIPACIFLKRTDSATSWFVYHRATGGTPQDNILQLNTTDPLATSAGYWGTTPFTDTEFRVSSFGGFNASGGTYVAYVFAHNAGGFGLTGTDNVISCGSYTGNGSATGPVVTLGYEPQWLMIKNASGTGNWQMIDNMRGMPVGSADATLQANLTNAESSVDYVSPTSTGFQVVSTSTEVNTNASTYIYIAIRRGPMKVPTSGTSVYNAYQPHSTGATISVGFPTDFLFTKQYNGVSGWGVGDRLRGNDAYLTFNTNAEGSFANTWGFTQAQNTTYVNYNGANSISYFFRRAPSFFDEVCYTGTGSAHSETHNLGVAPTLLITKSRGTAGTTWFVYNNFTGTGYDRLELNTDVAATTYTWANAAGFSSAPTSSALPLSTGVALNGSGRTYVAYLFATCAGVSKVGSYTGTGTTKQIDCGFTGGARFVLIKKTSGTGSWYVWDSARGIVSGNDPYLLLNSTAAEVTSTDYIDTYSAGFEISSTAPAAINASGGTFIFLAIA